MRDGQNRLQKAETGTKADKKEPAYRAQNAKAKDGMQRIEGGKREAQPDGEMRRTSADAEKSWPANSRATAELI